MKNKIITKNKKALYDYEIIDRYICGIVLVGSEVKSIKNGNITINESYCYIDSNKELFLKNSLVSPHKEGGKHYNHAPLRDRKLLMKKKEILKLHQTLSEKGLTIVPLEVMITKEGFVKVEIGLAKGKKLYDKSKAIKEKDIKRDLERNL